MRSYAVQTFGSRLECVEADMPTPKGTEVILDVQCCGVCHTDLHIQDGYYDLGGGKRLDLAQRGINTPVVMGHEVLGRLVAKGPDAPIDDDALGKTFLVYPWLGCGRCATCESGEENLCPKPNSIGVFRPGGYAERCLVPHPKYLIDVSGLDPAVAATYACSGVTAYSALKKAGIDKDHDMLLIIGLGGVGLSALHIAQGLGYQKIAVADIDENKRALALQQGVEIAVDPRDSDAQQKITAAGGYEAAVDFVGGGATAEFALSGLKKGGTYVAVGLFGGSITLEMPPLVLRSISIRGSYVGNLNELRELIDLVRGGSVKPIPVEAIEFNSVNDALQRLRKGTVNGRLVLQR